MNSGETIINFYVNLLWSKNLEKFLKKVNFTKKKKKENFICLLWLNYS